VWAKAPGDETRVCGQDARIPSGFSTFQPAVAKVVGRLYSNQRHLRPCQTHYGVAVASRMLRYAASCLTVQTDVAQTTLTDSLDQFLYVSAGDLVRTVVSAASHLG
jgi:hypothetical protein